MTVEEAAKLLDNIDTVITMLESAASASTVAEAYWQEHGDGSVETIWESDQKAAFVNILAHTKLRRQMLQNRKLA